MDAGALHWEVRRAVRYLAENWGNTDAKTVNAANGYLHYLEGVIHGLMAVDMRRTAFEALSDRLVDAVNIPVMPEPPK